MFSHLVLYNVIEGLNNLFLLQEAFADPARDESLILELLELKHDVEDNGSAAHFFHDLATEQDAEGVVVILMFSFILFPYCLSYHKSFVSHAVTSYVLFLFTFLRIFGPFFEIMLVNMRPFHNWGLIYFSAVINNI